MFRIDEALLYQLVDQETDDRLRRECHGFGQLDDRIAQVIARTLHFHDTMRPPRGSLCVPCFRGSLATRVNSGDTAKACRSTRDLGAAHAFAASSALLNPCTG